MKPSGFTLLEVLAVVLLASMAMATLAVGINGPGDAARLRSAAASMHDLDRRARLLAETGTGCSIHLARAGADLLLAGTGERVAGVQFARGIDVQLCDDRDQPIAALTFTLSGECQDYFLKVAAPGEVRSYRVTGLTGWIGTLGDQ